MMGKIEDMIDKLDPEDAAEVRAAQDAFRLVAINKKLRTNNAKLLAANAKLMAALQAMVDETAGLSAAFKSRIQARTAIAEAHELALTIPTPKPGAKEPAHG